MALIEQNQTTKEELNAVDTITVFRYKENQTEEESADVKTTLIVDDDDDLVVPRKKPTENILRIEHSTYTDVDSVGLQVWNGAVLLAEFIIFKNHEFRNKRVLELGCGTGLVSIIAAKYCDSITCTDLSDEIILKTIERNFQNNASCVRANYVILPFDFTKEWSPNVKTVINEADIIIASELVYDHEITENLVKTLVEILRHRQTITIYFTVEKRYIFTSLNKKIEAIHYEYFFDFLRQSIRNSSIQCELNQIIDIPQYFYEYERCKETELWCISQIK